MSELAKEIRPVTIEDELKQSYLDYAMSVIVGRALPDVRDGLKPVHRRVLYAMYELNNDWNKPYKKSARIVGDVIGKYHPHGDTAVYDTMVRMAQKFAMRYPLIDGQGNFGSVDGDAPAAMRYTEVRMAKVAHRLLADLDKDTVNFAPNYDGTEHAPTVLPTRLPNLLINGSSGIAVGMATNIPPHNISEVISAVLHLLDNPTSSIEALMQHLPGPDFPTAGIINGHAGIIKAYRTGRGRLVIQAKASIETDPKGRQSIIVTEIPYQVNKARLIERIAELVKEKKIESVSALRDESDKEGMRIVVEVKRGESAEVLLNNLYMYTQMQTVYGINMVALIDGQPRTLNLKEILEAFLRHRREVVTRRTLFDLNKARERSHLLEGLGVALANLDEVIALIKAAKTPQLAKEALLARPWLPGMVEEMLQRAAAETPKEIGAEYGLKEDGYHLSPQQAQAILDLRLHRLTGLEQDKILSEYKAILDMIDELLSILNDPEKLAAVIREELMDIKKEFGDLRQTQILDGQIELSDEDLITEEDVVVTLSHLGYVKCQPLDDYQAQRRGGRGKSATKVKEDDFIERLLVANSHDTILCFSNHGKVYWLRAFQLPQASRISRGKPIVNILPLAKDEKINTMLPVKSFDKEHYVVMVTADGTIKKTVLEQFSRPRASGIIAIELAGSDHLVGVALTDGRSDLMIFTDAGKAIRFKEDEVRPMGRTAKGVRGVKLKSDQRVVSLCIAQENAAILTATENGFGKRSAVSEYRQTGRGGQGVISIQVNERNGKVVRAVQVMDGDELMLITDGGTLVRLAVDEISMVGRNAQGVRLIRLSNEEKLVGVQPIEEIESEPESE